MMTTPPRILVIRFKRVLHISPGEAKMLDEMLIRLAAGQIRIFFSDVDVYLEKQLKKYNLVQKLGEDNIFHTIDEALSKAEKILSF